jgi:hypothetical protein
MVATVSASTVTGRVTMIAQTPKQSSNAGNWDTDPDPAESSAILKRCADIAPVPSDLDRVTFITAIRGNANQTSRLVV